MTACRRELAVAANEYIKNNRCRNSEWKLRVRCHFKQFPSILLYTIFPFHNKTCFLHDKNVRFVG